ncbi:MAG: peptidase M10 [Chitinophagaceae bacterium]
MKIVILEFYSMGEAFLNKDNNQLIITSVFILYGNSASDELAIKMASEVQSAWNETPSVITIKRTEYLIHFNMHGSFQPGITPDEIHANLNPQMNFFRVEDFSRLHISFVDEIGCNTGYFLYDNLTNNSTTAAHEYGHTIGLVHPYNLDIRGQGRPGIMYPRGTLVDAPFQWDPEVPAGTKGGTLNPAYRKVLSSDIQDLHLEKLRFNKKDKAILGDFTNLYHEKH